MDNCRFCGSPYVDRIACVVCAFPASAFPFLLSLEPDARSGSPTRPTFGGEVFLAAGSIAALRQFVGRTTRRLPEARITVLADTARIPIPATRQEPSSWTDIVRSADGVRSVWHRIATMAGESAVHPGVLVNVLAAKPLGIGEESIAAQLTVPLRGGVISMYRIFPAHVATWSSEESADDLTVLVLKTLRSDGHDPLERIDSDRVSDARAADPMTWKDRDSIDDSGHRGDHNQFGTAEIEFPAMLRERSPWEFDGLPQAQIPTLIVATPPVEPPAPFPPPAREQRFLDVEHPASVAAETEFSVACTIRIEQTSNSAALRPVDVPYDGTRATIRIFQGAGVELRSASSVALQIHPGEDSEQATFRLHAVGEARTRACCSFAVDIAGNFVGGHALEIPIGPPRTLVQTSAQLLGPELGAGDVALNIAVEQTPAGRRLRYYWSGGPLFTEEAPIVELSVQTEQFIADLPDKVQQLRSFPTQADSAVRRYLTRLGEDLWKAVIPRPIEEHFRSVRGQIVRMLFLTNDTTIPWELLHPVNDAQFLVEEKQVTRWRIGRTPMNTLSAASAHVAVPLGAPATATAEADLVRTIIDRTSSTISVTKFPDLTSLVDRGDFDLLHFACHDQLDADGILTFDGYPFGINLLYAMPILRRNPLVFVNASRTVGSGQKGSDWCHQWAKTLIERDAAAFVGTQWDIAPRPATAFANDFYESLLGGASLGEAAMRARNRTFSDHPADPTWLAYAVYGYPAAQLPT